MGDIENPPWAGYKEEDGHRRDLWCLHEALYSLNLNIPDISLQPLFI